MLRPLRLRNLWLSGGAVALAVILGLSLMPLKDPMPFQIRDKLAHFAAFSFLTVWFLGIVDAGGRLRIACALAAYGLGIELLQSLTALRTADPLDVVSDLAGIAAGWYLAAAGLHQWCFRLESWFGVAPDE
ncbi:MAG: VanZ family protein [Gammaproteobacteria bacterium]|nr:VanZ family protein [Gammaproteobacteria bacterium]